MVSHDPIRIGLYLIGYIIVSTYFTWVLYIAMMPLKKAYEAKSLNLVGKILGYPWLAIMLATDFLYNITTGSVWFLLYPQDLLFTERLNRMLKKTGWRFGLAKWICRTILDPYDPDGRHCSL